MNTPEPPGAAAPLRFAWTELLLDELDARRIPLRMLTRQLGLSVAEVEDLIAGRRELTDDLAAGIGRFLGTSTQLWLNLAAQGPSGDTVQAPAVAALPPEVVAVIEAARVWVANNARAGHTPTGPAARLDDAVCALLGTARALLGTDTTTEETP